MGNSQQGNTLKKEELDELHKQTHCTFRFCFLPPQARKLTCHFFGLVDPKELTAMYKQFRKETPSGVINKSEFKEVMKQMGVVDNFLQDLIFNVFDDDKDACIDFQEFVNALSVMTRGTPDEKLECEYFWIF